MLRIYAFVLERLRWVVIAALALCIVSGLIWYDKVYSNPELVWQKMLENNLKTSSVTRKISLKNDDNEVEQIVQLFFGQKIYANSTAHLKRTIDQGSSSVRTETLGTTQADFLRYTELLLSASGQAHPNTDSVLNVWGKQGKAKEDTAKTGRFLQEAILGIVPIGNLTASQRTELLKYIEAQQSYKVDYSKATKKTVNGRTVYEYPVSINPERYAQVLNKYADLIGLSPVKGIEPQDFAALPGVETTITVDILTRQLVSLTYKANGRTEHYLSFGLQKPLKEPTNAVELSELQNRLQSLR